MSNEVYPALPGLTFGVSRSPAFSTVIKATTSGREYRGRNMLYPRYTYALVYDILGLSGSFLDGFRPLLDFFNARNGAFDTFLFDDPDDNSVTAQVIGEGDGATVAFQLLRTLQTGGFAEPVYDVHSAPQIFDNGTLKTVGVDYTVGSTGIITFTTAPAVAHAITWTGTFYWRVRFVDDTLEFNKFMDRLWELQTCNLITCRP